MIGKTVTYNARMALRSMVKRGPLFRYALSDALAFRRTAWEAQQMTQLELLADALACATKARHYEAQTGREKDFSHPIDFLKTFPYVEKEEVRADPGAFLTHVYPRFSAYTSGTTGTPLRLKRTLYSIAREEAGFFLWYRDAGWSPGDMMAEMRGEMIIPATQTAPPFGVRDYVFNRSVLSSYHLSDTHLPWYNAHVRKNAIQFISAYPSAAYIFAEYLDRRGHAPLGCTAVFLASESVLPHFRALIEKYIGPVHCQYGNGERTAWMTTCSAGFYHEDVQYGFTEYLPCGDGMYEIVTTNFTNAAMPLVRYRTGDIAEGLFGWNECTCGKPTPGCRAIIGRRDACVVTSDGRRIGRLDHVFKQARNIIAAQIVQKSHTHCELRIMRSASYTQEDEQEIIRALRQRVGDMTIECTYCDELPRGARGKFHAVISFVDGTGTTKEVQ